jgi:hypothetical protein
LTNEDVAALVEMLARSADDSIDTRTISGTILGWLAGRLDEDPIGEPTDARFVERWLASRSRTSGGAQGGPAYRDRSAR